jgi:hypothetical protein
MAQNLYRVPAHKFGIRPSCEAIKPVRPESSSFHVRSDTGLDEGRNGLMIESMVKPGRQGRGMCGMLSI